MDIFPGGGKKVNNVWHHFLKRLTKSGNVMDADLVVHGDAHDGGIAEAPDDLGLHGGGQELEACDEGRMRLLDAFQSLKV